MVVSRPKRGTRSCCTRWRKRAAYSASLGELRMRGSRQNVANSLANEARALGSRDASLRRRRIILGGE